MYSFQVIRGDTLMTGEVRVSSQSRRGIVCSDVDIMLGQRRRRCTNTKTALGQYIFAGLPVGICHLRINSSPWIYTTSDLLFKTPFTDYHTAVQNQKTVTAHLKSEQLLLFNFVMQHTVNDIRQSRLHNNSG